MGAVLALWIGMTPLGALAEATVAVELRGESGAPVDGRVTLTKGEATHSCETVHGKCKVTGVAGGLYTVTVVQPGKSPPKPKQVMIPPDGEVALIVRGAD